MASRISAARLAMDTVAEQARDCLARIDALLNIAGSKQTQILQVTVWLADMKEEINSVWD